MSKTVLQQRAFAKGRHVRNVFTGDWLALHDEQGNVLQGIKGRAGVSETTIAGASIGVDLMEMRAGSSFPLHTHAGGHIMFFLSGNGILEVDGSQYPMNTGDTAFVAAEQPHALKVPADAKEPLVFLSFGHPHKPVHARDRMTRIQGL